jgi:hypothetical protein
LQTDNVEISRFEALVYELRSQSPLILQDVQQQFERGTSEKRKQKLEHSRYALMNHVALVWVRLDDVLHSQGGTMADPPKIRERKALENKVVMLELELRNVALVWVRLDDVLHSQGGTMADPPKIRERKALENKVVMLELELRKKISRRRSTPTRFSMSRS